MSDSDIDKTVIIGFEESDLISEIYLALIG